MSRESQMILYLYAPIFGFSFFYIILSKIIINRVVGLGILLVLIIMHFEGIIFTIKLYYKYFRKFKKLKYFTNKKVLHLLKEKFDTKIKEYWITIPNDKYKHVMRVRKFENYAYILFGYCPLFKVDFDSGKVEEKYLFFATKLGLLFDIFIIFMGIFGISFGIFLKGFFLLFFVLANYFLIKYRMKKITEYYLNMLELLPDSDIHEVKYEDTRFFKKRTKNNGETHS